MENTLPIFIRKKSKEYRAGFDSILNGPNENNCLHTHFLSPNRMKRWMDGRGDAIQYLIDKLNPKKKEDQLEIGRLKTLRIQEKK